MHKLIWLLPLIILQACTDISSEPAKSWPEAAQGIFSGALSLDSELNIIGSLNHGVSLWRTTRNERVFSWNHSQGEYTTLVAAAFSPDGKRAVTTDPRTLVLWDTTSGQALQYWATPATVLDIVLARDGHQVLMGLGDHSAILFDALTGKHLNSLLHSGRVNSVALSENQLFALTGSEDFSAKLWDLSTSTVRHNFRHTNPVRIVALSADAKLAFSAAQGQKLILWDATTGFALHTFNRHNPGVTSARFSRDGHELLIGYVHRRVELWDTKNFKLLASWKVKPRKLWQTSGSAVLELGFGNRPNHYYALSGNGMVSELTN
ncbi:MAG: hypothetical protein KUG75_01485 [Pseudomonadales bacterium]|nr:hypothetical protein [Pseudomonadales bacterium]